MVIYSIFCRVCVIYCQTRQSKCLQLAVYDMRYIYVYICVCICICICVCMCLRICMYIYINIHIYIYVYLFKSIRVYVYVYIYIFGSLVFVRLLRISTVVSTVARVFVVF